MATPPMSQRTRSANLDSIQLSGMDPSEIDQKGSLRHLFGNITAQPSETYDDCLIDEDDKRCAVALGISWESDQAIAKKIKDNLVQGSYRSVKVSMLNYKFGNNPDEIAARKISFALTPGQSLARFFQGIGAAFLRIRSQRLRFQEPLVDNMVASAMLGSTDQENIDDLIKACKKGEELHLFISMNLQHMEIKYKHSTGKKIADNCIIA